ncbi:MAG: hypothetical protein JXB48_23780 [Candidatus Latescibacteria bacterium]|nr:hypothetical protein [Candidatus Latescibacterota bacterium]
MNSAPDITTWPVLKRYDLDHCARIAMPVGGIGTGTVSLGGRGDLRDWELMNRAAKGFVPLRGRVGPFFALCTETDRGRKKACALEGPVDYADYEGSHGSTVPNHGLPRFRMCSFEAAYPFGQVLLSDDDVPVDVRMQAFNPLIPGDADLSGLPVAVLRFVLTNKTGSAVTCSVCGTLPNFIGMDGWETTKDWKGDPVAVGGKTNKNTFRKGKKVHGVYMYSEGIDPKAAQWGTMALTTFIGENISYRTSWVAEQWGNSLLDFWDDFSSDGMIEERKATGDDTPMMSLAVQTRLKPGEIGSATFFLTWHFPNRYTWTPNDSEEDRIGNYYATQYTDAWDVAEKVSVQIPELEKKTIGFVNALCGSKLPEVVKEAVLFNISTLRTQTCFRTTDGRFYGWEGSCDHKGCCHGSCTHVWNYEQALAFLFGDLAKTMREVEFGHATDENGLMSFRVNLPLSRARDWGKAAADGQMGCIMKMYRDWQLSGDDGLLKSLWPKVKQALEFSWIKGGWDADRDGVMEGCQHNTMDVEYYGPNPQMGIWYLGALRASEEMALYLGDKQFAGTCRRLYENGSAWIDEHLFNGEYYEHEIRPPKDKNDVASSLLIGMGAQDVTNPDFQLGDGCLVDQLVGQFFAHVCGLGYLVKKDHVNTTLQSIMKYNYRERLSGHFNCLRSFALGEESALLMASYPHNRPKNPFPYFTEVMTGFEYTAAVGMLYEGRTEEGLLCIRNIRERYDGRKRSPFDEAECGHHYSRAMASWAALLALTGFRYSGVTKTMECSQTDGIFFWSNGYAWGTCECKSRNNEIDTTLLVLHGELELLKFMISDFGYYSFDKKEKIKSGEKREFKIRRKV